MEPRTALATAVVILAAVAGPVSAVGSTGGVADAAVGGADAAIECEFPFTATDATGAEVTVEREPQRIVTLLPSAAQTVWEIGGREKVVGVSEYASYLDGAETRTTISGSGQTFVVVEKVVSLEPDLVLAPNSISNETVGNLRETGLTVFRFPSQRTIEDVRQKTLLTGQLTGECEGAEETVARMDAELDTVREATSGAERPRVLYVFFGYTGGAGTFVHEVIEAAGGTNVAAEANISGFGQISPEVVAEYDPEWIVVNDGATQLPKTAAYNNTHAVRNDQVVVVQEAYVSQPAPRIVRSVVTLAKAFHPEAYEQAASETATQTPDGATAEETPTPGPATQTPTPTPGEFDAETTATGPASTTASGSGPGLGVGAAAAALTALLVYRGRE